MSPDTLMRYITQTFAEVDVVEDTVNRFFAYQPTEANKPGRGFLPFATLVMNDAYDQASQLERDAVFRLNIGLRSETYRARFGPQPSSAETGVTLSGYDFTALDKIMPHPIYASMSWVCVLNPSASTFETVKPLLTEAYQNAVRRHNARINRG